MIKLLLCFLEMHHWTVSRDVVFSFNGAKVNSVVCKCINCGVVKYAYLECRNDFINFGN